MLINFSRNFGKEPALLAGIHAARGDVVIPMDVDLRDPLELLPAMVEKFKAGADVVLARRVDRGSDGFLKRNSANWFYKLINAISESPVEANVGDFRLMSGLSLKRSSNCREPAVHEGLVELGWLFNRLCRLLTTRALCRCLEVQWLEAVEFCPWGITSFSSAPLRVWTYVGSTIDFSRLPTGSGL